MPLAAMRLKLPRISWGGPAFTRNLANIAAGGSWAGGIAGEDAAPGLAGAFGVDGGGHLGFDAAALFMWLPDVPPFVRTGYYDLPIAGLTPGSTFGWRTGLAWIVNQVPENSTFTANTIGVATQSIALPEASSGLVTGSFLTRDVYFRAVVPGSGIVTIRISAQAHPSFNAVWQFTDLVYGELGAGPRLYSLLCVRNPEAVRTYSEPAGRSVVLEMPSGVRDGFVPGHHQKWAGAIRGVPWEGYDAAADAWYGWEGDGGWRAFLEHARHGGEFDFYPDQDDEATVYTCHLEGPVDIGTGGPNPDWTMHRRFPLTFRTVDGSVIEGY